MPRMANTYMLSGDKSREEVLASLERGGGYIFENAIVGGVVPKEYVTAADKGIQEAIKNGVLAGYPIVGVKAILLDGEAILLHLGSGTYFGMNEVATRAWELIVAGTTYASMCACSATS